MRKVEYSEFQSKQIEKKQEYTIEEETKLPFFATEVPISSTKEEKDGVVTVTHTWDNPETPWVRVQTAEYLKQEEVDRIYSLNIRDGIEKTLVKRKGFSYILRKLTKIVARSIFSTFSRIRTAFEKIVGFLTTTGGNTYLISKVEEGTWSFDKELVHENVKGITIETLNEEEKDKMFELAAERLSEIHSKRLLVRNFGVDNIMFTKNDIKIADPREVRATRKLSLLVEEFKNVLKSFISMGMARGAVYHSLAVYTHKVEEATNEWYTEKKGKKPASKEDIIYELEKELDN